jgi:hypothetical protein
MMGGGGEGGPALEVEELELLIDGPGSSLVQERERAPDRRDVDGLIDPVEYEDPGVEHRIQ